MKVIIYVFDSLRYDVVYDEDNNTSTPNLQSFIGDSVNFVNAFSQGIYTAPSSVSLFSGLYPETHGCVDFNNRYPESIPHIADDLPDETQTVCFSTTEAVAPSRGVDRGFDEFFTIGEDGNALSPGIMDDLNDQLLPWIDKNKHKSFFAVIWAMGTHHPYITPCTDDYQSKRYVDQLQRASADDNDSKVIDMYSESVNYSDIAFGEFIDKLKSSGIYNETTLITTSDHGELFDEFGRLQHANQRLKNVLSTIIPDEIIRQYSLLNNHSFLGHQAVRAYDELIHIPLIFKPSEKLKIDSGQTCENIVELVDVYPTVMSMFSAAEDTNTQGENILRTLSNKNSGKLYSFSTSRLMDGDIIYRSVRTEEYKLHQKSLASLSDSYMNVKSILSMIEYIAGKNTILVRSSDETVKVRDSKVKAELEGALQEHINECNQQDKYMTNEKEGSRINDRAKRQLEKLGYR